jgi:hypothetical protein
MRSVALLLKKGQKLGNGLKAIRDSSADYVDITEHFDGFDNLSKSCFLIHENRVYALVKMYCDTDNNQNIYLGIEEDEPYNVIE